MAMKDLVPLAPLAPPANRTDRATMPPAISADPATARAAADAARAQRVIPCRKTATSGQMVSLLAYLAILMAFTVYSLFCFWPRPTPNEQIAPAAMDSTATRTATANTANTSPETADVCDARHVANLLSSVRSDSLRAQMISICYFQRPRVIWKETQLVLLVMFAGGVGAILSGLRKSTAHFYKGDLCAEGLPGFYVWPFSGALTALVFYTFIRGGFFSGQSTIAQTSPYSFIVTALIAGMFTHEAVAKLKQVAETVLTSVDTRATVPASDLTRGATSGTASSASSNGKPEADEGDGAGVDEDERGDLPPTATPPTVPPNTVG